MEPVLTEQQSLLRDSAVRLCREIGGPRRARQLRVEGSEVDEDAWQHVLKAGWLCTAVPEACGGLGLGMFEVALVLEEAGRQLLALPLSEAFAAAWALGRCSSPAVLAQVLDGSLRVFPALPQPGWGEAGSPSLASVGGGAVRLVGTVRFVPYGSCAQAFLVLARDSRNEPLLCVVPAGARGLSVSRAVHVDGSTQSDLVFNDVAFEASHVVARGAEATRLSGRMQELLALGTSALLVGVANQALDMTLEYLKVRHQFGKPLGSFQALQHRSADRFVDIELNRSLVYRVFSAWDAGQCHPAMVCAAKARCSRCGLETGRAALQLHGAIGYTDEHDIGLYYKRLLVLSALYGNEQNHTARFSQLTL